METLYLFLSARYACRKLPELKYTGIWDGAEYMNEVYWPQKKLKQGHHIEMCFSYPDEHEENRYMWCCEIVTRVKRRDDKMIKVDIKWEESFIACGESDIIEEVLKKHLWNPETPKKYAWRQNVRQYLTTIE